MPAEPLLVRVEDAAQHEFAAGVDEFDGHGAKFGVGEAGGKCGVPAETRLLNYAGGNLVTENP